MEDYGIEARSLWPMLLALLWCMRYEWIACFVGSYVFLTAETFEQFVLAAFLWAVTWALQFVRPPLPKEPA